MPPKRKCKTAYCKNNARPKRKDCYSCNKKKWRKKYPMKAAFQTLRHNAKRRGKEFSLTFQQFKQFCYKTKYLAGRGRSSDSYSIDRIDNYKGYTIDNIRVITVAENSSKRNKILHYDWQTRTAIVT